MARSRRAPLLFALSLLSLPGASMLACNVVTGATKYDKSYCEPNCETTSTDAGLHDVRIDRAVPDGSTLVDAHVDSGEAPVHMRWAHWPMPNRADAGLPNPMTYATDGGTTVLDVVTKLEWQKTASPNAMPYENAVASCASLAPVATWRVPTRIELVSLLDESATPRIATVFEGTLPNPFWTSSAPAPGSRWTVDFGTGSPMVTARVEAGASALVRCVRGGVP